MTEILKTVLLLNLQGSVFIILLLLLKGVIRKSFSGKWQRNLWAFAALFMLLPLWKAVPVTDYEPIIIPFDSVMETEYELPADDIQEAPSENSGAYIPHTDFAKAKRSIKLGNIILFAWLCGVWVFLTLTVGSYAVFLNKKRKNSCEIESAALSETKNELKIRRKICVRKVIDSDSPLLTGVFMPVVYVPDMPIEDDAQRLIYLHELTHYKHRDLPIKWFVCFVNAVNWFNPFVYLIAKNLNEACEIYCDEAVAKNMSDEEKKQYMSTILNLVGKKGASHV